MYDRCHVAFCLLIILAKLSHLFLHAAWCRTHSQVDALFCVKDSTSQNGECLLMEKLAVKGWDVDGRLYLGFGRQRTSWESTKSD